MNHVKHVTSEGGHSSMDQANLNSTYTNHTLALPCAGHSSSMEQSSHSGHNHSHAEMMHASGGNMCKMDMYWNWYTIDACFLSKSWHITSAAMFAGSCIGIVLLVVLVEALRRCARELDRYIVRDWKKRAMDAAAAQSVNIDVAGVKGTGVHGRDGIFSAAPAAVSTGTCCGAAEPSASSAESSKAGSVTKPAAVAPTPYKKPTLLSCPCPYISSSSSLSSTATPRPTILQHLLKSLVYAVLLGVGYILMLLAMYYNGYIFFCLIIGAWLGNFLFGMDTCVLDESVVGAERGCGC